MSKIRKITSLTNEEFVERAERFFGKPQEKPPVQECPDDMHGNNINNFGYCASCTPTDTKECGCSCHVSNIKGGLKLFCDRCKHQVSGEPVSTTDDCEICKAPHKKKAFDSKRFMELAEQINTDDWEPDNCPDICEDCIKRILERDRIQLRDKIKALEVKLPCSSSLGHKKGKFCNLCDRLMVYNNALDEVPSLIKDGKITPKE